MNFHPSFLISGHTFDDVSVASTGHYVIHCIKDGTVITLDDDRPFAKGNLGDLRNSEIFFYRRL